LQEKLACAFYWAMSVSCDSRVLEKEPEEHVGRTAYIVARNGFAGSVHMPIWLMVLVGVGALRGAAAAVQGVLRALDPKNHPPPGQMIDVGGRRLHLLCKGDAPGRPS
jgi:hypothetical protein